MKRFILFLLIAIAVPGCKFLESIIADYGIFVRNDTNDHLIVWGTYDQKMVQDCLMEDQNATLFIHPNIVHNLHIHSSWAKVMTGLNPYLI